MTLILNGTDNSATTPAVTGTDTDTGVYYPAANQVALATNGTLVLVADASQNVGIAKSAPVARLHLAGTGTSGQVTASFIIENLSSGTMGVDITGSAGSSVARFRYAGGAGTGTNSMTGTFMTAGLEGVSAGTQGIYFAPTQVASADANTLDDYEEGTWTPTVSASSGSATYTSQFGTYVKIGRQVTINFWIYGSNKGTLSGGTCSITGLPFNTSATEVRPSSMFRTNSISITGIVGGWLPQNSGAIQLDANSNGGASGISPSSLPAGSFEIGGFITYVID